MVSKRIRVLLVEDSTAYATFVTRILHLDESGFTVKVVGSLHAALEAMEHASFDALILDLKLPDSDGSDTVAQMHDAFPATPIVVLSARRDRETLSAVFECGAQEYLFKEASTAHMLPIAIINAIERQRMASRLARTESLYETLFESIPAGVGLAHLNGTIVVGNAAFARMLGTTPEELRGGNVIETYADESDRQALLQELAREDRVQGYETRLRRVDGRIIDVRLTVSYVEIEGTRYLQTSCEDITDRKRNEVERARLMSAIENTAEMIVITDCQGDIQYVNPAFERITGYARDEVIGENPRLLKSGRQDDAFYRELWQTLTSGRTWQGRFVNKRKDGIFYNEQATITPVVDDRGGTTHYVAVKRDVTRLLELESQLRQSQKLDALGTLAGGVAHEINNPIMGIMSYAQLINDGVPRDSPLATFADGIREETQRVATIVRNLLEFARREPPGQSWQPAPMQSLIETTLSLIRSLLRDDRIALEVDVDDALPVVRCHPQQIRQVLMNLLTNARDALNSRFPRPHPDKRMRIQARCVERDGRRWVRTSVSDRGQGIPPAVRERIFEPFFTTKPRNRVTGLGLSISYRIVVEHGGNLRVDSEPGHGTSIHLELAVAGDDE